MDVEGCARGSVFCLPVLSLSEAPCDLEVAEPCASPDTLPTSFFKCWHCGLPFEPTAVGVQLCSCSAGIHVRLSPSMSQASTCRADVSQVGASPQGLRLPPFPADQLHRRVLFSPGSLVIRSSLPLVVCLVPGFSVQALLPNQRFAVLISQEVPQTYMFPREASLRLTTQEWGFVDRSRPLWSGAARCTLPTPSPRRAF